ncbi:tyrosine protein phosphatase [Actinoplanes sp. NPDC049548]|uniref:protein-tyrosine phosphatase family protein n=1 Tax=Actinoplanes sp. NPDC049548 TaxID=3155152 RepID=UPI003438EC76
MRPPLHVIAWPGPGRLATMAHPRGGERLAAEMAGLSAAGVDVVVSALTPGEERRLGLTGAAAAAAAAGIQHLACPIPDRGVPGDAVALGVRLAAHVRAGRFVVAQCFAGVGRSTLLAGVTLVMLGVRPERALHLVAEARGLPVPGTEAQRIWLYDFARAHGGFTGGNPVGHGVSAAPHGPPSRLALPACTHRSSSSTASTRWM